MDGEKARKLKRTAELTSRRPLTGQKRQRSLTSVQQLNSSSGGSRKSTSGRRQQRNLSEQAMAMAMAMEKWEGESNPKGSKTTLASDATCSRKRVKVIKKVSDNCRVVDSAGVPRKLRSAINKRAGESPSPCAVVPRRKQSQSDTKTSIGMATGRAMKAHILLTNKEEEVVEILAALPAIIEGYQHTKFANDGSIGVADDGTDPKQACLSTPLDESEVPLEETRKEKSVSDIDTSKQEVFTNNEAELKLNDGTKANNETPPLFMVDSCDDDIKLCDATKILPDNAAKQSVQVGNSVSPRSEVGPLAVQCTTSSTTRRDADHLHEHSQETLPFSLTEGVLKPSEAKLELQDSELTTGNHKSLTRPFPNKPDDLPFVDPARPCLGSNRSAEKPLLLSVAKGRKRCSTHGYICHLIQSHQNTVKASGASSEDQLNEKGTTTLVISESSKLRNGLSSSSEVLLCSPAAKSQLDMTAEFPKDKMFQVVLQPHITPGFLSQRKQTRNFLTLSAGCESISRGNGTKLSGNLPITYQHTLPSQHLVAPLSVSHGHYSSYPNYVSATTPHQVHLQAPQYISHPFYTSQSGNWMKHEFQQQQQIWQAHLSQYTGKLPGNNKLKPVCDSPPVESRGLAGPPSLIPVQHQRIPLPLLPASNQSS